MKRTLLIVVLSLLTLPMMATIVIPPASLAEMAYNSDLVIYARAESHQNGNSYINNFRVLEVIKGDVSKDEIVVVEEYGGIYSGKLTVVSGDVDFKLGYNYVLFLSEVGTGNYKARQLSMGVFEEGNMAGQYVLGRNGTILDIVLSGGTAYNYNELTGLYLTEDFVNHMRAVMNGAANWNYINAGFVTYDNTAESMGGSNITSPLLEKAAPCPNDAPCHCATLFGPPGASQTKYEDNNWTVCVAGGAQTDPTNANNITDLQTAITAMNGMVGINISYTGVDAACSPAPGCTSAGDEALACAGGFGGANCNKMFVFFDDPCMQIPDVDGNCAGTLGIGGHFASGTHVDACGDTWNTACNPFFVMNNFGVCAPNTVNQNDYVAVLIHEMLHAVGVGHHYDASAFTTTDAANNPCAAAGANNPINAEAGTISHDGNECTGIMNPVICNNPAPAPPDFSITAYDNACTDWMYNITDASACAITNVVVTNVMCNGDDLTFDVTFDYTDADEDGDGNTTFSVELDGAPVATMQPVTGDPNTATGQMYSVTVTGPTAGGMSTITIRNDAVFSCTGDALNVDLPQCPAPCADNCMDLMSGASGDCGNSYYPDAGTYPGAGTTSMNAGDGSGSGCQDYSAVPVVLPAGSGASHTICTQYTAGSDAAAFVDFLVAGDPGCIDQSIAVFEAATCTDVTTLGATVTQPGGGYAGQATGLTGNTDYIVCFTYTENGCADDFSGSIFEICPDIVEIGAPACTSIPDVTFPTDVCNGDNVLADFGANCMPNPDLGATSGYGLIIYVDGTGAASEAPMGTTFTFQDLIDGNPNLAFVADNGGGCADIDFAAGLLNGTCDPINVSFGVFPLDVAAGASFPDCPIDFFTVTIHPNYEVIEDIADGCDPIAGAFISDGVGGFFDVDGDGALTFADACFTAQLDPTADCTDGATLNYDFEQDILAANPTFPGCGGPFTGTLTCSCTTLMCMAVAEPDMPEACAGADFQVDVNSAGGCVADPFWDDEAVLGAGVVSGYIAFYYSTDGGATFEACPAGFTGADILTDPNVVFFGESNAAGGGACAPVDILAFTNNTCAPIDIPVCLVNGDVTNFFVAVDTDGDGTNDFTCDVVNTTATIYPNLMAMIDSEDPANCGTLTANLMAEDGVTVCATETATCAADGEVLSVTFTTLADGTPIDDAATCSTLTATSATPCAGCNPAQCQGIDLAAGLPVIPTEVCSGATADICLTLIDATEGLVITGTIDGVPVTLTGAAGAGANELCVSITAPANETCAPADVNIQIDAIQCTDGTDYPAILGGTTLVDDLTAAGFNPIAIPVYPTLSVNATGDGMCGDLVAELVAADGTVCATAADSPLTCAADGDALAYDFTGDPALAAFTAPPADCPLPILSGNLTCSGCTILGCTDPCAPNYDPAAGQDDGSCQPYDMTCNADCTMGPFGGTWDPATCACINETTPVSGCTDPTADNYDPAANCDDGSCMTSPVCSISVSISNFACDDNGTPDDPSDDMVTFDYTVNDIGGTGTTWTDGTLTGQAYGAITSVGPLPADGTAFTINVNDEADTACTATGTQVLNDCATVDNIPTVGEWGLIMLALLMSIVAIVGIRQKELTVAHEEIEK